MLFLFVLYFHVNNNVKVQRHGCVICCRVYSGCGKYIAETIRNSEIKWSEQNIGKDKNSDRVKHLNVSIFYEFRFIVLHPASKVS